MVRKKLTREEEEQLAAEIESHRGNSAAAWDFSRPKRLRVTENASAVLSARVSYDQLKAIREIAERERLSLSEVTKQAIEMFVAAAGASLYTSRPVSGYWSIRGPRLSVTETQQPGDQQLRNGERGFRRPDKENVTAA